MRRLLVIALLGFLFQRFNCYRSLGTQTVFSRRISLPISDSRDETCFVRRRQHKIQKFVSMAASHRGSSQFFQQSFFAVVGASTDRNKFGNKVLRCYAQHRYAVTPINKKQPEIEGIACIGTLTEWYNGLAAKNPDLKTGVSIITPPGVTKLILQEGISLGIKHFYLQPGTYDSETDDFLKEESNLHLNIVKSCVLVELGFDDI